MSRKKRITPTQVATSVTVGAAALGVCAAMEAGQSERAVTFRAIEEFFKEVDEDAKNGR